MPEYVESAAVVVASRSKGPPAFTAPPRTVSPTARSTGSGSPVRALSSMMAGPACTVPSTGTTSPGRTRSRSPTAACSTGTSDSSVPAYRWATFGARPSRACSSRSARLAAHASRLRPVVSITVITAPAKCSSTTSVPSSARTAMASTPRRRCRAASSTHQPDSARPSTVVTVQIALAASWAPTSAATAPPARPTTATVRMKASARRLIRRRTRPTILHRRGPRRRPRGPRQLSGRGTPVQRRRRAPTVAHGP